MSEENRDILIELRADMKHVREKVDHLTTSDTKQWEKLDTIGAEVKGHEKSIEALTWGQRIILGGAVTVVISAAVYVINK